MRRPLRAIAQPVLAALSAAAVALLAGCQPAAEAPAPAPSPPPPAVTTPSAASSAAAATGALAADGYLGRWVGVEGLVLEVTRTGDGSLQVHNVWSLDRPDQGRFAAEVVPEGLRWVRNGQTVTARRTDGAATGLKWLDGKSRCLTVAPGEGYCRD